MVGLAGLLNLLLQKAEGLADFGEIIVFICEALKTRRIWLHCYGNGVSANLLPSQAPDSSSCFSTENHVFSRMNLKPAMLCLIAKCVSISAKSSKLKIRNKNFTKYCN